MKNMFNNINKVVFFVVALFLFSIFTSVNAAEIEIDYDQELSKECTQRHCNIPVPTLISPDQKNFQVGEDFHLTGLTWNNTDIDIYLDGNYQGSATVNDDEESDTANFYFLVDRSLLTGDHQWQVVAWSRNKRSRSFSSSENIFTVGQSMVVKDDLGEMIDAEIKENEVITVRVEEKEEIINQIIEPAFTEEELIAAVEESFDATQEDISASKIDGQISAALEEEKLVVDNNQDKSDEKSEKSQRNRTVGVYLLILLIIIIVVAVVNSGKEDDYIDDNDLDDHSDVDKIIDEISK
jgi:hypothetical protein